ncbi:oxidoreductase [Paenibacillus thalictri]|nr:oxidoreductase [Paenibacillus thalictri]
MGNNRKIGVGIIGYGFSAKTFHVPLLKVLDEYEIRGIVSSDKTKVHRDLPEVEVYADLTAMLEDMDIQLVINTAPNELHFPLTQAAIAAGRHVVVEKPFVNTYAEGKLLAEQAEAHGVVLSVYHNRRWDNNFRTVQALHREGTFGEIMYFESRYDRYAPVARPGWRSQNLPGSGILYDLGSHLLDQAITLLGLPLSITADAAIQREGGESCDYFHLLLDYGKTKAVLHSGVFSREAGPRFQVHGTKASFVKHGTDPQENALKQGLLPVDDSWGREPEELAGWISDGENGERRTQYPSVPGDYRQYYRELKAAIAGEGPNPVTAEHALTVIRLIELANLSASAKRTVFLNET